MNRQKLFKRFKETEAMWIETLKREVVGTKENMQAWHEMRLARDMWENGQIG